MTIWEANLIKLKSIPSSTLLGLRGKHQYENASTAFTAAKTLIPNISKSNVIKGLKRTQWHGRIEYIEKGQITKFRNNITILDGSHNEDGAVVLENFLNTNKIVFIDPSGKTYKPEIVAEPLIAPLFIC